MFCAVKNPNVRTEDAKMYCLVSAIAQCEVSSIGQRWNAKKQRKSARSPFQRYSFQNLILRQLRLVVDKPASKPSAKCPRKLIFSGLRTRGRL